MIWVPRVLFSLGILLAGVSAFFIWQNFAGDRASVAAGKVIQLESATRRQVNGGQVQVYCPIVAFTLPDGRQIRLEQDVCSRLATSYHVGQDIEVRFDPDNPQDASFGQPAERYLVPLIFGILATLLLAGGIFARRLFGRYAP